MCHAALKILVAFCSNKDTEPTWRTVGCYFFGDIFYFYLNIIGMFWRGLIHVKPAEGGSAKCFCAAAIVNMPFCHRVFLAGPVERSIIQAQKQGATSAVSLLS